MGGFFGTAFKKDCIDSLFFGTDYHCHLGTRRGGLTTVNEDGFARFIHDITNAQFRSKFESDVLKLNGNMGIGVISDYEDQPLLINSHLGSYAIATVGVVNNTEALARKAFNRGNHFSEMTGSEINPTELVASLIDQEETFEAGIKNALERVEGSCSILLLTKDGIYAARDRLGRTPIVIGKHPDGYVATMETCAFPNLNCTLEKYLGPGEVVFITPDGVEDKCPPGSEMQICSFLWIYYGYPASSYEGLNVEATRYRCGAALADRDDVEIDYVAGVPDSGTAHALGYADRSKVRYCRPFVKYTPTWPRSFMPQDQTVRELVAKMKLIPIPELTKGRRLLFCEDSIVRGTQLRDTIQRMYEYGAKEVHMRPACPPLLYGCKFLNFSRSRSELDLAGRKAFSELENGDDSKLAEYADQSSDKYRTMEKRIGRKMGLTTLRYQRLDDMIKAIGLPEETLCTYCWDGCDKPGKKNWSRAKSQAASERQPTPR
jgi:amidophosphoribosyltransferase